MKFAVIALAPASLLISAQAAPPPIIVHGEVDRAARIENYVRVATAGEERTLARFQTPVCPRVVGLSEQRNREIEQRMRRVATAAGMQSGAPGCSANVLVAMTANRADWIGKLQDDRPPLFAGQPRARISGWKASKAPAISWQTIEQRGADGRELDNGNGDTGTPAKQTAVTNSRLLPQTRNDVGQAVVLFDARSIVDLTVTEIADYAAMLAYARIDPDAAARSGAPTILSLFADKAAKRPSPLSVTQYDLAYLKALYSMSNMLAAGAQRGEIRQRMTRAIAGGA